MADVKKPTEENASRLIGDADIVRRPWTPSDGVATAGYALRGYYKGMPVLVLKDVDAQQAAWKQTRLSGNNQ